MSNTPPTPLQQLVAYSYFVVYKFTTDHNDTERTANHSLSSRYAITSFVQIKEMEAYIRKDTGHKSVTIVSYTLLDRDIATFEPNAPAT